MDVKHLYKAYRNGVYLGLIYPVISEFDYHQDINTVSTELEIEVAQNFVSFDDSLESIETEDGEDITTEDDIVITTSGELLNYGDKDSGLVIADGNDIEVWEYTDNNPDGVLVFYGYQTRTRGSIDDVLTLTVVSQGIDTNNHVYGNSAFVLQTSQNVSADFVDFAPAGSTGRYLSIGGKAIDIIAQSFSGHSYTLSKLRFEMARGTYTGGIPSSVTVTLSFYQGAIGSGTLLDTVTANPSTGYPTFGDVDFILNTPITLVSSNTYHVRLTTTDYTSIRVSSVGGGTGSYGGGGFQFHVLSAGGWSGVGADDLSFKLYTGTILVDAEFLATDPADMVREAVDGYPGVVSYTGSSIDNTSYSLDYTFKLATVEEIIRKSRELAPANWYYYVDPATQILYFKETPTTATHLFTVGNHILDFMWESTIEGIKNVVYFTGGPTSGVNLLKKYTDVTSLAVNKVGLERLTDNRIVTANEDAAETLSNSYMEENSTQVFKANPVTIHARSYDINTINIGDTVKVQATNSFISDIIFQITSKRRLSDSVTVTFGKLPIRSSTYVDGLKRRLDDQQTLDNPDAPS